MRLHVANAFSFQPPGFFKALYQFTSSAVTNRDHAPEAVTALVGLGSNTIVEALGLVTRIWDSIADPNLMTLEPRGDVLRVTLFTRTTSRYRPPSARARPARRTWCSTSATKPLISGGWLPRESSIGDVTAAS